MEFIVFRFEVPGTVVTDNGTKFVGKKYEDTLQELNIKHSKASVAYPQCNGQVEVTNSTILRVLNKRVLIPRGVGQMSFLMFYDHTEQHQELLQEIHHSKWHTEHR